MSLVDVEVRTSSQVAIVTLNRPEARNALSSAMHNDLDAAWQRVLDADDVGAVVLTGTDPAFCAGNDLGEVGWGKGPGELTQPSPLESTGTPVVAAINGACMTGGLELVLPCDFLLASERAWFADTHVKLGLQPGRALVDRLMALAGVGFATEMSLSGRRVDANEALRTGLVNRVVAHDDLLPAAVDLATRIAANDRETVRSLKRVWQRSACEIDAPAVRIRGPVSGFGHST